MTTAGLSHPVRIGVVGLGYIGALHARYLAAGAVRRARLGAVCDTSPRAVAPFEKRLPAFRSVDSLVRSELVDAVLIATPQYLHAPIAIQCLEAGLHVLVEKPLALSLAEGHRMLRARRDRRQVFAIMFNQRANPLYRKVKDLLDEGATGPVQRISFIMTEWFRPDAYYASAPWRGTWRGEGGGILMNQYAHHLDLLQWLCGMPRRIRAFAGFGRHHPIQVEDDVTAYLEYPGGATGMFVGSTGEAPGANRLEIAGDLGQIVAENGRVVLRRNAVSAARFRRTSKQFMGKPKCREEVFRPRAAARLHQHITRNFVDAILDRAPLVAPAEDGLRSLEIANAMIYSAAKDHPVSLPLDEERYEEFLCRQKGKPS